MSKISKTYDYKDTHPEEIPTETSSEYWEMVYSGQPKRRDDKYLTNPTIPKYMFIGSHPKLEFFGRVLSVDTMEVPDQGAILYKLVGKKIPPLSAAPNYTGIQQCQLEFEENKAERTVFAPHKYLCLIPNSCSIPSKICKS